MVMNKNILLILVLLLPAYLQSKTEEQKAAHKRQMKHLLVHAKGPEHEIAL
jgi:hypothetical protein